LSLQPCFNESAIHEEKLVLHSGSGFVLSRMVRGWAFAGAIDMIATAIPTRKSDKALMAISSDIRGRHMPSRHRRLCGGGRKKFKIENCRGVRREIRVRIAARMTASLSAVISQRLGIRLNGATYGRVTIGNSGFGRGRGRAGATGADASTDK
jgi:hypothetical protein